MIDSIIADFNGKKEDSDRHKKVVESIDDYLLSLNPPNDFSANSPNNIIRDMELSFEKLCASMEEAGINSPKTLTVFEFYSRIDFFESKKKSK